MDTWYQCTECVFGSNSAKSATAHIVLTGHSIEEQEER